MSKDISKVVYKGATYLIKDEESRNTFNKVAYKDINETINGIYNFTKGMNIGGIPITIEVKEEISNEDVSLASDDTEVKEISYVTNCYINFG